MFRIFKVSGSSMLPTLRSGDWIVTSRHRAPRENEVVVASIQSGHHIVKRVAAVSGDAVRLVGDNKRLASSHCEKPISGTSCVGTVLASFRLPFTINFDFPAPS